jgi:hypothetical protein
MNRIVKNVLSRIPIVKKHRLQVQLLKTKIEQLQNKLSEYVLGWPPGDFYSPIP